MSLKTHSIFTVFGLILLGCSPAFAGWQWADWGMTSAQLQERSPLPLSLLREFRGVQYLGTTHSAVGHIFSVELGVGSHGLQDVVLSSGDVTACTLLKAGLREKYGASEANVWPDAPEGFVLFGESADHCKLLYSEPHRPSTDGL